MEMQTQMIKNNENISLKSMEKNTLYEQLLRNNVFTDINERIK
jgi:hypothetical protein